MQQQYMIFPITEKEQEFLEVRPQEFDMEPGELLGMLITPSRVREGIHRWVKKGSPNPIEGNEVSDVVRAVQETLLEKHQIDLNTFESEIELYKKRLTLRNEKCSELQEASKVKEERVRTYELRYGELRSHPFNWFQILIGRMFRLIHL